MLPFAAVRWLLALGAPVLLACSPAPGGGLWVLSRLGDAALTTSRPLAPQPLRLGSETRLAVCVPPGSAFRVEAPDRVRRVIASLGARSGDRQAPGARFEVRTGARSLLDQVLLGGRAGWHDVAFDLAADAGARSLEFRAELAPGPRAPDARLCWGSVLFLGEPDETPAPAPNVVLLSLDTLGASYLSSFSGAEGVSPRIDAFLADGFSFRRAYAQYPGTLISHTSLFTGLHPVHHGRYDRSHPLRNSLVSALADHGYLTAAFTEDANVGSAFGFAQGFDQWDDGEATRFEAVSGNAATTFGNARAWLEGLGAGTRFFLFVHTYEVHSPYTPPAEEIALANRLTPGDERLFPAKDLSLSIIRHNEGRKLLSERDIARLAALYTAEIHHLDRVVGEFLEQLARLGLERNTLVVLTSDHGEQFGELGKLGHAQTLHNRALHVPLGFRWPGVVRVGALDTPVELVDVMPTIFGLAGLALPALPVEPDGRSFAGLLRGETTEPPPGVAFSELHRNRGDCLRWRGPGRCWLGRYAVQTGRYKYVVSEVPPWERLVDLVEDPDEARDVAAAHPAELERHRSLLARYRGEAAPRGRETAPPEPLDALTRDRLEGLGYLE